MSQEKIRNRTLSSKRKHNIKDNSEENKEKMQRREFDEVEFKFMLKDAATMCEGFKKFMQKAETYPEETSYDIIAAYCKSSPQCSEIFAQLDYPDRKPSEKLQVLEALHAIVMYAVKYDKHYTTGSIICSKIISSYMGLLYSLFASYQKSWHIKLAIKLLTALVMLGEKEAQNVYTNFSFSHPNVPILLNRRDLKDPQDVRTCLINFMLSFLITGDSVLTKTIVETKGNFLCSIFPGLPGDKCDTIITVLSVLLDKIVKNPSLTKTGRIRVLNQSSLCEIAQLYRWIKPVAWNQQMAVSTDESGEDAISDEQFCVRQAAHSFLLEVCCSFTNGINFYDKTFGCSGKNMNHILTHVLESLTRPYQWPTKGDLVVHVLQACPDQLQWYLPSLKASAQPRPTSNWKSCMDLLTKVYRSQDPVSPAVKVVEQTDAPSLVQRSMSVLIPPTDIWAPIISTLKKPCLAVQHEVLQFLCVILERVSNTIDYCSSQRESGGEGSGTLQEFVHPFREALRKVLPDTVISMTLFKNIVHRLSEKPLEPPTTTPLPEPPAGGVTPAPALPEPPAGGVTPAPSLPEPPLVSVLMDLLQFLTLYHRSLPPQYHPHPINIGVLIEGVQVLQGVVGVEDMARLQLGLLQLLSYAGEQHNYWTKEASSGKTFLYLMLEMVMNSKETNAVSEATQNTVSKMLVDSGIFTDPRNELCLWLDSLKQADTQHQTKLCTFVHDTIISVFKDPYTFTERVLECMAEGRSLGAGQWDTASIGTHTDQLVDMVLSMDPVDLSEGSSSTGDAVADDRQLGKQQLVLTPLLPAALQQLPHNTTPEVLAYMGQVVWAVAWGQQDPLPLCALLKTWGEQVMDDRTKALLNCFVPEDMCWPLEKKFLRKVLREASGDSSVILLGSMSTMTPVESDGLTACIQLQPVGMVLTVTRQLLLCLHHSVTNYAKNTEVYKVNITHLFEQLGAILKQATGPERRTHTMDPATGGESCSLSDPSVSDRIIEEILQHPTLLKYFLWVPDLQDSSDEVQVSALVTSQVCQLISDFNGDRHSFNGDRHGCLGTEVSVETYVGKLRAWLALPGQGIKHKVLSRAVQTLMPHLARADLVAVYDAYVRLPWRHIASGESVKSIGRQMIEILRLLNDETVAYHTEDLSGEALNRSLALCVHVAPLQLPFREVLRSNPSYCREITVAQYMLAVGDCEGLQSEATTVHSLLAVVAFYNDKCKAALSQEHELGASALVQGKLGTRPPQPPSDDSYQDLPRGPYTTTFIQPLSQKYPSLYQKYGSHLTNSKRFKDKKIVKFIKTGISDHYEAEFFTLLRVFIDLIHADGAGSGPGVWRESRDHREDHLLIPTSSPWFLNIDQLTIVLIRSYKRLVQHEDFKQTILLTPPGKTKPDKECLLTAMLAIASKLPSVCTNDHLLLLMSGYSASLSTIDQTILCLLQIYEKNGCSILSKMKPFVWGEKCLRIHEGREALVTSLKKEISVQEFVDLCDPERMWESCVNMPFKRKAPTVQSVEVLKCPESLYDPGFMLLAFTHVLAPENLIYCRKWFEHNCVGFMICSLSSVNAEMRGLAYNALNSFIPHLEGSKYGEKEVVLSVLRVLKNSVKILNQRLSPAITVFVAKALRNITNYTDHMTGQALSVVLKDTILDLKSLPQFTRFFASSRFEFKIERSWILSYLCESLRDHNDYLMCQRRHVFKILQGFYDSPVSDHNKAMVLKVLQTACRLRNGAFDLVSNRALLPWLAAISKHCIGSSDQEQLYLELVKTAWTAIASDYISSESLLRAVEFRNLLIAVLYLTRNTSFLGMSNCLIFLSTLESVTTSLSELRERSPQALLQGRQLACITWQGMGLLLSQWCHHVIGPTHTFSVLLRELLNPAQFSQGNRAMTVGDIRIQSKFIAGEAERTSVNLMLKIFTSSLTGMVAPQLIAAEVGLSLLIFHWQLQVFLLLRQQIDPLLMKSIVMAVGQTLSAADKHSGGSVSILSDRLKSSFVQSLQAMLHSTEIILENGSIDTILNV